MSHDGYNIVPALIQIVSARMIYTVENNAMHSFVAYPYCAIVGVLVALAPTAAFAGITVHESGDKYAEIGGRMQVQYMRVSPDTDGAGSTDDLFFRRLRLYVAGSLTEDIKAKWQVDFGGDEQDAETKDAYIKYTGLGLGTVTVGNHYVPFSREALTSSKRQQLVERTFVGDHDFGVPDRQIGVSLSGGNNLFQYTVGGYQAGIDNSTSKVDFESRASKPADDNFYLGNLAATRLNWTPLGDFKKAQGAFGSSTRFGLGVNAYTWHNDGDTPNPDNDTTTSNGRLYDTINGYGIDAAFRSGYFSADAAYQIYRADTVDSSFTGDLIENGDADFATYMVKGGYMLLPNKLEGVVSYSVLDSDAFSDRDKRLAFGVNWFINQYKDKIQLTYEHGSDVIDTRGNTEVGDDQNTLFLQFQHVL